MPITTPFSRRTNLVVSVLSAGLLFGVSLAPRNLAAASSTPADTRRPLEPSDILSLADVGSPEISPEGDWVAYTVTTLDAERDEADTQVWMVPMAGGEPLRLTTGKGAASRPRFSPDGRYLAFLATRDADTKQVFLLDRRGGEARRLTSYPGAVSDLAWSPDGRRLALIVGDPDPAETATDEATEGAPAQTPPPIVVTRRQFKRDGEGYLDDRRDHLYVFDLVTKGSVQVTSGSYDHAEPTWSPDGALIALVANRTADPDANQNTDVFVVEPLAGATLRAVATDPSEDHAPAWSPDGRWIAYVHGGPVEDLWYGSTYVALAPRDGGPSLPLTRALDRNVVAPRFSHDGGRVYFLLEDGGNQHLAAVAVTAATTTAGGAASPLAVERVVAGEREVTAFAVAADGSLVVRESQWDHPEELSRVGAGGELVRLTRTNDALLAGIHLAPAERYRTTGPDGTEVDWFLTRPPGAATGVRLPTVLRIHGGPTSQYATGWQLDWQLLAAHGYAVVAANPRGSTGYGAAFARALWADWGNPDRLDVLAAVDHAIALGVADPERLGVGGWSYGGILTNYLIARSDRFEAAVSGASETNYLANYGVDHYQYEWEVELGLPWENVERWIRLSPWFEVAKVKTPTLVLCGQEDWNVPLINSEQLYMALRRLGVPTELVIYPGQGHSIEVPSYQVDRYERTFAWYDRYLRATP